MHHIRDSLSSLVSTAQNAIHLFEDSEPAIPKTGKSENILPKSGILSAPRNHHPKHHNSPQNHHNFTTKNHHEKHTFPATPLKNSSKRRPQSTQAARKKIPKNYIRFLEKLRIPSTWKSFNPALSTYTSRLFPLGSVGRRKNPVSSTKSFVLLMIPSIISPS